MMLKLLRRATPKGTPNKVANMLRDTGAFQTGPLMYGMQTALDWVASTGQPYRVTIDPNNGATVEVMARDDNGMLMPAHRLRLVR